MYEHRMFSKSKNKEAHVPSFSDFRTYTPWMEEEKQHRNNFLWLFDHQDIKYSKFVYIIIPLRGNRKWKNNP